MELEMVAKPECLEDQEGQHIMEKSDDSEKSRFVAKPVD